MKLINQSYCLENQGRVKTRLHGDIIIYIKSKAYSPNLLFFNWAMFSIRFSMLQLEVGLHLFLVVVSVAGVGFKSHALGTF